MPRHMQRFEREIDEILGQSESLPPPTRTGGREPARHPALSDLSGTRLLLISFAIMLSGVVFDDILPFAGAWLVLAGAMLFITSFTLVMFGPHRVTLDTRATSGMREFIAQWRSYLKIGQPPRGR